MVLHHSKLLPVAGKQVWNGLCQGGLLFPPPFEVFNLSRHVIEVRLPRRGFSKLITDKRTGQQRLGIGSTDLEERWIYGELIGMTSVGILPQSGNTLRLSKVLQ